MTNSESLLQFGPERLFQARDCSEYSSRNDSRPDLFDFAFKEYARRWMFKRPYPADFFRSVEDASGVDLDWFWRGWFYSTDHVDIAVTDVRHYQIDNGDPAANGRIKREERNAEPETLSQKRNKPLSKRADKFPELKDFYNSYDDLAVTDAEKKKFQKYLKELKPDQRRLLGLKTHFYIVDLENRGGLVMPVILKVTHSDKTTREIRLPAEIWVKNALKTSRLIMSKKAIVSVDLDPHLETADVDTSNNHYPPQISKSRFKLYKEGKTKNEMQKAGLGRKDDEKNPDGPKVDDKKQSKDDTKKDKE